MFVQTSQGQSGSAHVVVPGNEKGGSGKSTAALHVAVALLKAGQRVATIDLDCRQQSFTRYINNRSARARRTGLGSLVRTSRKGTVAQTIGRVVYRPANSTVFCQCAKNYIDSTNTAAAPR
jgi:chromosome partitioning protein